MEVDMAAMKGGGLAMMMMIDLVVGTWGASLEAIQFSDWDSGRGGFNDALNARRKGLMSYKQFIQELEGDVPSSEADQRLKDKYYPTNLVSVMEREIFVFVKVRNQLQIDPCLYKYR
ncbi:hypothetical protein Droror1_Dr00001528 [Drosera rotundifolia]